MRDRLIELLKETFEYTRGVCIDFDEAVEINADHLLANGVIVPPVVVDNYSGSWKRFNVLDNALALIKELIEENGRLASLNQTLFDNNADLEDELAKTYDLLEEAKADTVRKMQEKLKEYLDDFYTTEEDALLDVPDLIDQIAKEMLEEER